jgi:hypothetical protein
MIMNSSNDHPTWDEPNLICYAKPTVTTSTST